MRRHMICSAGNILHNDGIPQFESKDQVIPAEVNLFFSRMNTRTTIFEPK